MLKFKEDKGDEGDVVVSTSRDGLLYRVLLGLLVLSLLFLEEDFGVLLPEGRCSAAVNLARDYKGIFQNNIRLSEVRMITHDDPGGRIVAAVDVVDAREDFDLCVELLGESFRFRLLRRRGSGAIIGQSLGSLQSHKSFIT